MGIACSWSRYIDGLKRAGTSTVTIGQRDHRADTGDRHQAPAHIIVADDGQQAAIPARADPPRAQVKVVE